LHTKFQDPTLSSVSVAVTLKVCMNAMLVLFMVANYKVQRWDDL